MATEVTVYVDPDATGTGDGSSWTDAYTALETAQSAKAKDLTSSDEIYIFLCRSSGGTADTTTVDIASGWTTDSTRYLVFRANTGDEALKNTWSTSRYRLSVTDGRALQNSTVSNPQVMYFESLQIESIFSTVFTNVIYLTQGGGNTNTEFWSKCRIRATEDTSAANRTYFCDENNTTKWWDCIIEATSANHAETLLYFDNGTHEVYNSIVKYARVDGVRIGASGTLTIKNCAVFDNADDFEDAGTTTIDYCASDDGDGTNSVAPSGSDWDNEFNAPDSGDYTILNTGNCHEGGTDNPGSGLYSDDMEGDSWVSPWSIGVDQYPAVSGTNMKINIDDSWKTVEAVKINIDDSWKTVVAIKINIDDSWKTVF